MPKPPEISMAKRIRLATTKIRGTRRLTMSATVISPEVPVPVPNFQPGKISVSVSSI